MKAVLLCGGFAKRLWPITLHQAKPLLKINKRPVIDYIIGKLNLPEIDEIIISTNQKFEKMFQEWMNKQDIDKKMTLAVEPAKKEGEKFGVIKALKFLIDKYKLKDDLLVIGGDNLFDFSIKDFLRFYHEKNALCVAVYDLGSLEKAKLYGIMDIDEDGLVTSFVEKPENPKSTLASTCCYVFPKHMLDFFGVYINEGHPKDNPGSFLQWFFKRNPIYAYSFDGHWFDIGNKEQMKKAEEWVKKERIMP